MCDNNGFWRKNESRNLRLVLVTRIHAFVEEATFWMTAVRIIAVARSMKLQTSNRFEVLGADVNVDRSQHEVSLESDPAKNQDETESWCTKVTKQRSSRFKDTQLTHTMRLQFPKNGHGEEMVNWSWWRLDACFEHYGLWSWWERNASHNLPAHSIDWIPWLTSGPGVPNRCGERPKE